MEFQLAKQYSVFLENRVGALAELCRLISDQSINLYAVCAIDTVEEAVLRIVPEKGDETRRALKAAGFRVIEADVFLVTIPNTPGATGHIAAILAENGINIDYIYASVHGSNDRTYLVVKVQQIEETKRILKGNP
ncbi:MAG: ACT domain-containing protein [Desulfobacterales bacterium]